jgi:hypothetical protein
LEILNFKRPQEAVPRVLSPPLAGGDKGEGEPNDRRAHSVERSVFRYAPCFFRLNICESENLTWTLLI